MNLRLKSSCFSSYKRIISQNEKFKLKQLDYRSIQSRINLIRLRLNLNFFKSNLFGLIQDAHDVFKWCALVAFDH